jgi:hypothetical protein
MLVKSMRFSVVTSVPPLILANAVGVQRDGADGAIGVEVNGKWGLTLAAMRKGSLRGEMELLAKFRVAD